MWQIDGTDEGIDGADRWADREQIDGTDGPRRWADRWGR